MDVTPLIEPRSFGRLSAGENALHDMSIGSAASPRASFAADGARVRSERRRDRDARSSQQATADWMWSASSTPLMRT